MEAIRPGVRDLFAVPFGNPWTARSGPLVRRGCSRWVLWGEWSWACQRGSRPDHRVAGCGRVLPSRAVGFSIANAWPRRAGFASRGCGRGARTGLRAACGGVAENRCDGKVVEDVAGRPGRARLRVIGRPWGPRPVRAAYRLLCTGVDHRKAGRRRGFGWPGRWFRRAERWARRLAGPSGSPWAGLGRAAARVARHASAGMLGDLGSALVRSLNSCLRN